MREEGGLARRGLRTTVGVGLGSLTAAVELVFLIGAGVALLAALAAPRRENRVRAGLFRCARQLAGIEHRRLTRYHRVDEIGPYSGRAAFAYLTVRWLIGLLGALVLALLAFGLVVTGTMLSAWVFGGAWGFIENEDQVSTTTVAVTLVPGVVLLYLNLMGIVGVADLDARTARRYLGPSTEEVLQLRVSELSVSRAEVVRAVNDERRRIERDLHDGVQQRLVALGMLLSRARRSNDADRAADLVRQAHEESQQALHDLREVAWRVYPTVLDQLGLHDVLGDLADRSSIPVVVQYELTERPPAATETVAYFVISEAVSNAVKHSGAGRIHIAVAPGNGSLVVMITDDGKGGADPAGRGLTGLAGRVAATDGSFSVESPAGGPTVVRAELPCG